MVELCCDCDDGLGVWHVHRTFTLVERDETGERFAFHSPWLDQPGLTVVEQFDYVRVSVDWRGTVRALELAEAS